MSSRTPVMLVDGYNVVGAWIFLQEIRDQGSLELARYKLVEVMASFTAYQDIQTTLVFDAYNQRTPGVTEKITAHLKVHYTEYRQTADSYIEKTCAQLRRLQRVIVVTSDRAQEQTTTGFGAEWMPAALLEQEVRSAEKMLHSQKRSKITKIPRLDSVMNHDTLHKLTDLRGKLP